MGRSGYVSEIALDSDSRPYTFGRADVLTSGFMVYPVSHHFVERISETEYDLTILDAFQAPDRSQRAPSDPVVRFRHVFITPNISNPRPKRVRVDRITPKNPEPSE